MNAVIYSLYHKQRIQSFPFKQKAMEDFAKKKGLKIIKEVEEMGGGDKRQKLLERDALVELGKRKEIDVIIVWSFAEWGRSINEVVLTLAELNEYQIRFISISDNFDSINQAGQSLFAWLSKIVGYFGQGRPLTVYKKADRVKDLFYKKHLSQSEIARQLNIGRSSVQRLLRKEEK